MEKKKSYSFKGQDRGSGAGLSVKQKIKELEKVQGDPSKSATGLVTMAKEAGEMVTTAMKDLEAYPPLIDESRTLPPPTQPIDRWIHRGREMRCRTCMYYVIFRCRRYAPNGEKGWSAVFPDDYCGEHKMSKETMNDIYEGRKGRI